MLIGLSSGFARIEAPTRAAVPAAQLLLRMLKL